MTSMTGDIVEHDRVLEKAAEWKAAGRGVALATVVATWGSSPRPVGSQLVVDDSGDFVGSVSGGCIEGAVVTEARQTIADGQTRLIDYGISDETAWQVGLACGGKCEIFIEPVE
ncbi:MAG: XdhC family protein [Alphaproteobacteria bacterium]|jgi:xanthine/CO dehydrogenase XdhC/CoxF family maturation factor